jgi:PAS domain S-box-containing protein
MRPRGLGEALLIALAFAASAAAQQYSFRFYGPAEGLQNQTVLSLAQDRAGYIWAGTEGGLYRYDGTRFRLMGQAEGLPCSTEVHGLFVAGDGALWANTCAGIYRFDGQSFAVVSGINRLLRGAQVMADGPSGVTLISTSAGLYEASRGVDGTFGAHPYPKLPPEMARSPMHGLLRDGTRLWFGCDRQLCMEEGGRISVFGSDQGLPEDDWDGLQISADSSFWARSPRETYRRGPGQTRFSQEKPDTASSGYWGALASARDGSIMVPTDHGLAIHTSAGWSVVNRQWGLKNENTAAVLEDSEGSVWLGLAGGGVARWLGRGVWESWKTEQGLPSDVVWNIRRDRKGSLWVATSRGLTRIDSAGKTRSWTKKDGLGGENVRWLAETSDGSIWATMKPGGLARIDSASGNVRLIGPKDGLPCDPEDVFVDSLDRVWLPAGCGLFIIERPTVANRVSHVETPASFGRSAWKVIEDKQGTIWVTNHVLWSLRDGQWREHGRSDGLLTDYPYVMVVAGDGSIWMRHRYDAGIDRIEVSGDRIARAAVVVPADPKTAAGTAFHGFDTFGNLWRGTTNGVEVLHNGAWTTFTTEDGLVANDCDGEAFWADPDGSIWMGTSAGLAHYRSASRTPAGPPAASPTIARLDINRATRLIQAEFSSLSYKSEDLVRFAYRLDQGPWTDSVGRNISIGGLGPGRHRLEVRCRVRDGPFSAGIAATEFRLEPKWTETWWTRLLAVVCMVVTIVQFVRWRLSAAAERQVELEAIVSARTANLSKANRSLDDKARELRSSEDRLKNAERLAHVGHWDWDIKTDQLSWSEEMFRIFDVPRQYTPSYEGLIQAAAPEDRQRLDRWARECLTNRKGGSIEFQVSRPNGDLRIVSCTSAVSLDDRGDPMRLFGACQDITDSLRAQQEDFARKKLESVGTLASGIAHDFNNLLGGVLAQADLALATSTSGAFPQKELTAIRNVAIRGSEIVRQLMMYAGKESEGLALIDVSQIVVEMIELLKVSVSKRARLVTDLGRDLPPVRASAAQIRQIVMNLVTNASEATGDRDGVIRVTTRQAADRGAATGCHVQLEVSDAGCGMSQETQAKVFDPFFSTKGAGHGLGLAVVQGIVRALGGTIHIASEPDRGSTFEILLPCAEAGAETGRHAAAVAGEPPRPPADSIVLVVEDEEALREPVVRMLRMKGFEVLEAADGAKAIDLIRVNADRIDVILLDMTIPGASSHEVVAAAAEARPDIKVILTSAYSREMLTPPMTASQIHGFIRKPYQIGDLVQVLRKAAAS